jgi:RES domain-containing protein
MTERTVQRRTSRRISSFRIVKRKFVRTAFSGLGARLYGGRWNSVGTSMIYTAGSLSLAILEWRVHLAQWPPPPLVVIEVEFDEALVWTPARLPQQWKRFPPPRSVAALGDNWIKMQRSAVMRVPSAVVSREWNYLLNPNHRDFSKVIIGRPREFHPDERLGRA